MWMYFCFWVLFKFVEINIDICGLLLKYFKGEGIGISKYIFNIYVMVLRILVIDVKLIVFFIMFLRVGSIWDRVLCCCRSCVSSFWNFFILIVIEGIVEKCKIYFGV